VLRYLTIRVEAHEEGPSAMMRKSDRDDRGDRVTAAIAEIGATVETGRSSAPSRRDEDVEVAAVED